MTKAAVRQRIQTNSQNVADGLERLQDELLELFNSQLAKYQDEMLSRDEETRAMVAELVRQVGEVNAGIGGLAIQLAELVEARGDGGH